MDQRPIGVFDSGVGGLTVLKELVSKLPHESFIYLGDTARFPYGTRSKEAVIRFSFQDCLFLLTKNVKCIVAACHTVSSYAGDILKESLEIPLFDVVSSGVQMVKKQTKNLKVGVIGTRATISINSYKEKLERDGKIKVFQKATPLLVSVIEEGEIQGKIIELLLKKYLAGFKKVKIDTLILGCTHFPLISEKISEFLGKGVSLINPAVNLSEDLFKFLKIKKMESSFKGKGKIFYYLTDINKNFIKISEMFLGQKITENIKKIDLDMNETWIKRDNKKLWLVK